MFQYTVCRIKSGHRKYLRHHKSYSIGKNNFITNVAKRNVMKIFSNSKSDRQREQLPWLAINFKSTGRSSRISYNLVKDILLIIAVAGVVESCKLKSAITC